MSQNTPQAMLKSNCTEYQGYVVYFTYSINPLENEAVIASTLSDLYLEQNGKHSKSFHTFTNLTSLLKDDDQELSDRETNFRKFIKTFINCRTGISSWSIINEHTVDSMNCNYKSIELASDIYVNLKKTYAHLTNSFDQNDNSLLQDIATNSIRILPFNNKAYPSTDGMFISVIQCHTFTVVNTVVNTVPSTVVNVVNIEKDIQFIINKLSAIIPNRKEWEKLTDALSRRINKYNLSICPEKRVIKAFTDNINSNCIISKGVAALGFLELHNNNHTIPILYPLLEEYETTKQVLLQLEFPVFLLQLKTVLSILYHPNTNRNVHYYSTVTLAMILDPTSKHILDELLVYIQSIHYSHTKFITDYRGLTYTNPFLNPSPICNGFNAREYYYIPILIKPISIDEKTLHGNIAHGKDLYIKIHEEYNRTYVIALLSVPRHLLRSTTIKQLEVSASSIKLYVPNYMKYPICLALRDALHYIDTPLVSYQV